MKNHELIGFGVGVMKANGFIKRFGILKAQIVVERCTGNFEYRDEDGEILVKFHIDELKRLLKSHEIVDNFGGLKRAERILKKAHKSFNCRVFVVWNDIPFQCSITELEQAISDVESCQ